MRAKGRAVEFYTMLLKSLDIPFLSCNGHDSSGDSRYCPIALNVHVILSLLECDRCVCLVHKVLACNFKR
jgi:hypothetical protein